MCGEYTGALLVIIVGICETGVGCRAGPGRLPDGIGSDPAAPTMACNTDATGTPPDGVRRDSRGLRNSLTDGVGVFANIAAEALR